VASVDGGSWVAIKAMLAVHGPICFTAGDSHGRKFEMCSGMMMNQPMWGASFGKWPLTAAIGRLVSEGKIKFSTRVCDVFSWWTKEPDDHRSHITLSHLLTFTSGMNTASGPLIGFSFTHNPVTISCLNTGMGLKLKPMGSIEDCAKEIYNHAIHDDAPGKVMYYNSLHLQVAFAMAVKMSHMDAHSFLDKYLYKPAHMTQTSYGKGSNPMGAGEIVSTMTDVDSFIRHYMQYKIASNNATKVMDTEYIQAHKVKVKSLPPVLLPSNFEWAMGHSASKGYKKGDHIAPWVPMKVTIQEWAGASGWQTYIDRTNGVYMASVCPSYKLVNPISLVMREVYAALGRNFPDA